MPFADVVGVSYRYSQASVVAVLGQPSVLFGPSDDNIHLRSSADATQEQQIAQSSTLPLAIDLEGKHVWSTHDFTITVRRLPQLDQVATLAHPDPLSGLRSFTSLSVGRTKALVGGRDTTGRMLTWNEGLTQLRVARTWRIGGGIVGSTALNPDETHAVFGTHDGTIAVFETGSDRDEPLCRLEGYTNPVEALAFHPDGGWLASGGQDRVVRLWQRTETGYELFMELGSAEAGPIGQLFFSRDGQRLFLRHERETAVRVWHLDRLRASLTELDLGW